MTRSWQEWMVFMLLSNTLTYSVVTYQSSQSQITEASGREGESGIYGSLVQEKTGRLTALCMAAIWNNLSRGTGTAQYTMMRMNACLSEALSANNRSSWHPLRTYMNGRFCNMVCEELKNCKLKYADWPQSPSEPCAANQLQSLPHPYKGSLMWARPLNSTLGSHKATVALIRVRRNLMLFVTMGETLAVQHFAKICDTKR